LRVGRRILQLAFCLKRFEQGFLKNLMKKPTPLLAMILMSCVVVIAGASLFEIVSPDLFWHLKMGEDLLSRGLNPFVDHYSFTLPGAPIRYLGWLFQVVISLFFRLSGFIGIDVFRFINWSVGLFLLNHLFQRQKIDIWLRATGFSFFLFVAVFHSEPRPDLLSLTLEILTILLMSEWAKSRSWKLSGIIGIILIFWTNYHSSVTIGYVIVGAFLIDRGLLALLTKETKDLKFTIISSLLFAGAGVLNHDFIHPLIAQSQASPRWIEFITEYRTRSFDQLEFPLKIYWILIVFALPGLFIGRYWAGLIAVGVLAFKSWSMSKLFPHLIVVTLPFVLAGLQVYLNIFVFRNMKTLTHIARAGLIILFAYGFSYDCFYTFIKPLHPLRAGYDENFFPVDVMGYMKNKNLRGNIFNEYADGGFILFNASPQLSVYIDGRTSILYPIEFYEHYIQVATDPLALAAEADKFNIKYILGKKERPGELIDSAIDSRHFELDYFGKNSALLARHNGRFPKTTHVFLHPECLREGDLQGFEEERRLANETLPPHSTLVSFLGLISEYETTKDKITLFSNPHSDWISSSYVSRLAAVLAGRQKEYKAQYYYLSSIMNPNQDDKINRAELDCLINQCEHAEDILTTVTKGGLRDDHIYRAVKILDEIKAKRGFKIFTEERVAKSRAHIQKYIDNHTEPVKPNWCN